MNALDGVGNHPSGRALAGPLPPTPARLFRPGLCGSSRERGNERRISRFRYIEGPSLESPGETDASQHGAVAKIPAKNHIFLEG
jgi:hypothetical protein